MLGRSADAGSMPPLGNTLRWVVVLVRVLSWLWVLLLVSVVLIGDEPGSRGVVIGAAALATVWTGATAWAGRVETRLGSPLFVILDGVVVFLLAAGGLLAGTDDFFAGSYPESWLFVVAFAANLRWTVVAAVLIGVEHALLHVAMGLPPIRTAGTINFLVIGFIVGWAFDNLRLRERLRLDAQERLAQEKEATARHHERAQLAQQLHDSVLQTLHAIEVNAEDAPQVKYLARRQERELRRTIEDFRSPHDRSFRATLLHYRDEVEDLHRSVKIVDVIRDDREITNSLAAGLAAAREALLNAAKHAGVARIDLYSEIADQEAVIHVRDRGQGFDPAVAGGPDRGLTLSILDRIREVGGSVVIESAPGKGTEVTIRVPVT